MIHYFFLIAISLLPASIVQREATSQLSLSEPKEITLTGIVVALGGSAVREDGRCRQLMVVRVTSKESDVLRDKYLLVPRHYTCDAGAFTNETVQRKQKWTLRLTRGADCDSTYEQIQNFVTISPGGEINSVPWMKIVPGNGGEKISATQKLLCYDINGEIKRKQ